MPIVTTRAAVGATPLWIIALFIALSEVTSGVAAMTTDGPIQTTFTVFSVAFPVVVLGAFVALLVIKPANLYPPDQFPEHTSPEQYAQALAKQRNLKQVQIKEIARAVTEVIVSDAPTASPEIERRQDELAARLESFLNRASSSLDRGLLIDTDTAIEEGSDMRGEFAAAAVPPSAGNELTGPPAPASGELDLDALAARYNDIRATQRPGFERTSAMTGVVAAMMDSAGNAGSVDWSERLFSLDRGKRLSAYAYLHVKPECAAAAPLVDCLTQVEDKPFGQYWALKALRRVLDTCEPREAEIIVQKLGPFGGQLSAGTDRRNEFDEIVRATTIRAQN